jgi:hypothetical protein
MLREKQDRSSPAIQDLKDSFANRNIGSFTQVENGGDCYEDIGRV